MAIHFFEGGQVKFLQSLLQEPLQRNFMRRSMYAHIRYGIEPQSYLKIQVMQTGKLPNSRPEIFPYITDSVFNLALGTGTIRLTTPKREPMVGCKSGKTLIPDGLTPIVLPRNNGLHVVVKARFGTSAEILHRSQMTSHQCLQFLILCELHIHRPRISQDHHKCEQTFFLSVPIDGEVSPVYLCLLAWRCFKTFCCLGHNGRTEWLHKVSQDGRFSCVPHGFDFVIQDHGI